MGSGASLASQLSYARTSDYKEIYASFTPEEREKLKAALDQVPRHAAYQQPRQHRRRIKCCGQSFAPFGMRTDIVEDPVMTREFKAGAKYTSDDPDASGLPEKVDLRNFMSPVENQSNSNSCCANATAGAFEYLNRKHCQETGDVPGDISRLFIYYVGRKKDMDDEAGMYGKKSTKAAPKDVGMTLASAISAMQLQGACLASSWPFDLENINARPSDECFKEAQQYRASECQRIPVDLDAMRECLASGNPIVFGLMLTDQFFRPGPGGFIKTPNKTDQRSAQHGLHAMLLVGYNDRQQVFIVRNSWGEHWGDQGYCYVGYDYIANVEFNLCQQFTITGLTNADFTPDPDDGKDFNIEDDPTPVVIESDEEPEEPDAEDDFDFSENFKGDQVIRLQFIEHGGKMNRPRFQICLSLYHRSEAGKNFDWLAADAWVAEQPEDKIYWTPEDFNEVVTKFYKKSDAEKYPNLAFLWA